MFLIKDAFLSYYQYNTLLLIQHWFPDRSINGSRADGVDTDLSVFQVKCPATGKRTYCSLASTVFSIGNGKLIYSIYIQDKT